VVFRALVFKLLVWCGAEGYVSGLQDAAHPAVLYSVLQCHTAYYAAITLTTSVRPPCIHTEPSV